MSSFRRSKDTGAPTQDSFTESLLRALARAVGYEPGKPLPMHLFRPYTIQIFGQTHGVDMAQFERQGRRPEPIGLNRKIQKLVTNLQKDHGGLTKRGPDPKWGEWALTERGVERARKIDRIRRQGVPNLTAKWLGDRLRAPGGMEHSDLYKSMASAVASKCKVSATTGQVEDHVSECLTRLMHRDSLRNRIMLGRDITTSHLCTYAVRSAWSDARNSGTNPVCREIYGARTETERKRAQEDGTDDRRWKLNDKRVQLSRGEDGVALLLDIAVDDADEIEDSIHFDSLWNLVLAEVQKGKPKSYERYIRVIQIKLQGGTTSDIADDMNVSKSRAAGMLSEARRVLLDARDEGLFEKYRV